MVSREELAEVDPELLYADGFDHCILGVSYTACESDVVAYDTGCVIKTLMDRDDMDYEEANEFFGFNILSAYMGERTPTFIETFEKIDG